MANKETLLAMTQKEAADLLAREAADKLIAGIPQHKIVNEISKQYGISERVAYTHVAKGRRLILSDAADASQIARERRIAELERLYIEALDAARSGDKAAWKAVVASQEMLILVEGLRPADRVQISGTVASVHLDPKAVLASATSEERATLAAVLRKAIAARSTVPSDAAEIIDVTPIDTDDNHS